ncbi:MAG: helix-turn-helix domain-containing protein [Bacteroidetes bacterium]|nr:helix-turn-helix domain-containing protein [Bacteroidota bacterium]
MRHTELAKDLGQALRQARELQHLSQLRLALDAHVQQCSICHLEKGKLNVTIDTLLDICQALHLKVMLVRE